MAARILRLAKVLSLPTTPPQNLFQNSCKRHDRFLLHKAILSASPRTRIPHRSYSTQPSSSSNKTTPKSSENATEHNNNEDIPDVFATLKSLKMSRTTKIVVYAALTIMATAESVFWIKVLWAKFAPAQKDLEDSEQT